MRVYITIDKQLMYPRARLGRSSVGQITVLEMISRAVVSIEMSS